MNHLKLYAIGFSTIVLTIESIIEPDIWIICCTIGCALMTLDIIEKEIRGD